LDVGNGATWDDSIMQLTFALAGEPLTDWGVMWRAALVALVTFVLTFIPVYLGEATKEWKAVFKSPRAWLFWLSMPFTLVGIGVSTIAAMIVVIKINHLVKSAAGLLTDGTEGILIPLLATGVWLGLIVSAIVVSGFFDFTNRPSTSKIKLLLAITLFIAWVGLLFFGFFFVVFVWSSS
jgi:hypothetical protein